MPFAGRQPALEALVDRLAMLRRAPGDQLIVVDNRATPLAPAGAVEGIAVIASAQVRSPAYARNAGAAQAEADWLVFVDADTEPAVDLLDAYLDPPPADDVGVLGGSISAVAARSTLAARYAAERELMHQCTTLCHPHAPFVKTANCAIRRGAFEAVGGFTAEARAGEDADLCWRLRAAGWRLEERPAAAVVHRDRETFAALLAQQATHGAGCAWLNRRYPGSGPPPSPRELAGRLVHYPREALRALRSGDREQASFALLDLAALCAFDAGRLRRNRARG